MSTHGRTFGAAAGLTLIELVVAIAVVAILLVLAVPNIQESIKNNRLAGQNNELIALISLAKNEAIRRNDDVTLELESNGSSWNGNVRVADGETTPGCPPGAIRCSENTRVNLQSVPANNLTLTFNNRGYLVEGEDNWTTAVVFLTHEECSGTRQRRRIEILPTGQISSCGLTCAATTC